MSRTNRLTALVILASVVAVMTVVTGRTRYGGESSDGPLIEREQGASDNKSITEQPAQPTPTIDHLDSLTPTELHWASYIYDCLWDGVQLDRIVVRQSTLAQTFKILGGDMYDRGREPVWIIAYVSSVPVPNDALRLAEGSPLDPVATILAATPNSSKDDVQMLPTLDAPYGANAQHQTTGYCAYNEEGDWVAKEIVQPVIAEYFMTEIEQLPRVD